MPIAGHRMTERGMTGSILVEPSGKHVPYGIGRPRFMTILVAGFNTKKLLPSDSVYWRELLWLEKFDESKKLEDFSPGRYRVINNYNYDVSFDDKHTVRNSLYDSTSFILSYNSGLIETIKLIPEYLKNFFWCKDKDKFVESMPRKLKGVVSPEALVEYLYQNLLKIRRLKSPFTLYADYLLPDIASFIKYRRKRAIILADEFMKKYPSSPLCEEMAFLKGKLIIWELPIKPERDSIIEVWLKPIFKQYPKNAYRFAFGDIWKKLD